MMQASLLVLLSSPAPTRFCIQRFAYPYETHCRQQTFMAVGHDEIHLGGSARAQVLEHTHPAVFAFLGTGSQCQHFFVSVQVHSQRGQDHGRIGLVAMTHTEMDPIKIKDPPVFLQWALPPGGELLLEILVEAADGTGTGRHSHQCFGDFPNLVRTDSGHEHLREPLGHLGLVAAVALEDLGVELALAISGNVRGLNAARRRGQVTGVGAVAISLALGATLSPTDSDERIELLTHHVFQHDTNGAPGQFAQMLLECLLIRQRRGRLPLR